MSDLQTQLREYGRQLDSQTTPLEDLTPQQRFPVRVRIGRRGPLVAVGTAAAIIVAAVTAALLIRGPESADPAGPPSQPTATTVAPTPKVLEPTEPEGAFSWDGDDLTDWITEEEMTLALRHVLSGYAESDLEGAATFDHESAAVDGDGGQWELEGWTAQFHNGDHGGRYVGPPHGTDRRLAPGVTFEQEEGFGWGHYIFKGPNSDEMISIWLRPPERSYGYPAGSEIAAYRSMLFPLATRMLQEMGWADFWEIPESVPTTEPDRIPLMDTEQFLYGAGDIGCPKHWAHDQSLPVGSVEFLPGPGMFTVAIELVGAAPNSEYRIEVLEPETCWFGGPDLFDTPGVLATDETGAGRIESTVRNVEPGTYRLNINVVHNDWEDNWPESEDIRLREIGGAGFSLVEVP